MAKSPPPPELVQAYQLIKQGQPQQAGQLLKTYLKANPQDAEAWWLMAHAVSKPEHVRRALESVLKIDPTHEKARRKLAQLDAAGTTSSAGTSAEVPDHGAASRPVSRPVSRPAAPPPPPPEPRSAPASFEEYERGASTRDPFSPPVVDDPFTSVPTASSAFGTAAHDTGGASGTYDPFAASNKFDPAAAARLRSEPRSAQAAGTGNQPEWGPGLAFVQEGEQPAVASKMDFSKLATTDIEVSQKPSYESMIGWALAAVAVVVLVGLIAYFALNRGEDKRVGPMDTVNASTFTMSYPKGYDVQCAQERLGYQVCGIANHPLYNELDLYLGSQVNIGNMLSEMLASAFIGGSGLPDEAVSIVVMDVPENSPAYDPGSWAKTKYEWSQGDWGVLAFDEVTYHKQNNPPRQVNGRDAYYYEYVARDDEWGRDIAYDVYIPHDGIMLWMTVSISGAERGSDYRNTVDEMIESIQFKPLDQWGS